MQWLVSLPKLACPFCMNFTTQAAQDIAGKIERDPVEIRHWRQLLILCFDQKAVETLQVLQVVCSAIDQIWNKKRQQAKEAHEVAKQKQRATGSREPLPPLTVSAIALDRQAEGHAGQALARAGVGRAAFPLRPASRAGFRPAPVGPRHLHARPGARAGRRGARWPRSRRPSSGSTTQSAKQGETTEHMPKLDAVIAPESMGVKSPSHHRPSAAALIKRTGRLSVDRSRIEPARTPASETVVARDAEAAGRKNDRAGRARRAGLRDRAAAHAPAALHRALPVARVSRGPHQHAARHARRAGRESQHHHQSRGSAPLRRRVAHLPRPRR